jgi:hypothetical protein
VTGQVRWPAQLAYRWPLGIDWVQTQVSQQLVIRLRRVG